MLTVIGIDLMENWRNNSSNRCSVTSVMNFKMLDETNVNTYPINPLGSMGKFA